MNWNERIVEGRFIGFELITNHCHYFFGSAKLAKPDLQFIFPEYEFRFIKQVHGNDIVPSQPDPAVADGHWTTEKNVGLVIQTADCMPVLIGHEGLAIAVHAGWRGVEAGILSKAAELSRARSRSIDKVLIGPHILADEFEVGLDVAERLEASHRQVAASSAMLDHADPAKKRVNLAKIGRDQMAAVLGRQVQVEISPVSTLSSPHFHSFRRGKSKEARQYSFIVLR